MGEDDKFDADEKFNRTLLIVLLSSILVFWFVNLAYCVCCIVSSYYIKYRDVWFDYRESRERRQQQNDIERGLRRSQTTLPPPPPQIPTRESPRKEVQFRARIKVVTYDREKTRNKSDPCCAICLADFEDGDNCGVVERCQHMYHRECIETSLKQWKLHCPCCRGSIPVERRLIPASEQSS